MGNAPFGYTPGNSFNDAADGSGAVNASIINSLINSGGLSGLSGLREDGGSEQQQRSGSFSVIPGITEYASVHGKSQKVRKKSGSSHKSDDAAAVIISSSPSFPEAFVDKSLLLLKFDGALKRGL